MSKVVLMAHIIDKPLCVRQYGLMALWIPFSNRETFLGTLVDDAQATRQIVEAFPGTKVILLTSYGTSAELTRAMANGAVGTQMKGSPIDTLLKAIRTVAAGGKAIAPEIRRFLRDEPQPVELSQRQREILLAVSHGKTSDQIADDLGISVSAVKQHITAACEKLGASSRAEAAVLALRKHLLKI